MRQTLWYLMLCHSITQGDVGQLFLVLEFLTFSFWGAGATNYGNEMLEMACNFLGEFSPELQHAVKSNFLVNPSGRPGEWHELDLLQEHFNKVIKTDLISKSEDFGSEHMGDLALNVPGFKELRAVAARNFDFTRAGTKHKDPDKANDINYLGANYLDNNRLQYCAHRPQPYLVTDEHVKGYNILFGGQFKIFIDRTTNSDVAFESTTQFADTGEAYEVPPPLVCEDGQLGAGTYALPSESGE
ncbi:hypothetical protein EV714DRAFT_274864 [Schizophyllum commune]